MSYRIGIDYYQTECDEKKEMKCRACKAVMDVSRGVMTRTGPYHPNRKLILSVALTTDCCGTTRR